MPAAVGRPHRMRLPHLLVLPGTDTHVGIHPVQAQPPWRGSEYWPNGGSNSCPSSVHTT